MLQRGMGLSEGALSQRRHQLEAPIKHVFSHVKHTYHVSWGILEDECSLGEHSECAWLDEARMKEVGITTGMKKIYSQVKQHSKLSKK